LVLFVILTEANMSRKSCCERSAA